MNNTCRQQNRPQLIFWTVCVPFATNHYIFPPHAFNRILIGSYPIRRICNYRIELAQRRQDFHAIAVIKRGVTNSNNVAHFVLSFASSARTCSGISAFGAGR